MRTLISILWISFFPLAAAAQGDDLSYRLKKVIKDKKAEIGIAVILDAQDTVTVNNDDRYPLMSVFKFHQALAVADYLDRNGLTPDTEIFIPEEELVPDTYSPLRKEFPEGEISLSVSRLLEYSLQLSDNNACDILFEHTGGPAATDRYVRSLGLRNFAIAATEQQMHDDPQTCYENWSTPLEAAALLELLVTEQILTPTLREMIRQNLINCKTGADRLPKPLSGTGADMPTQPTSLPTKSLRTTCVTIVSMPTTWYTPRNRHSDTSGNSSPQRPSPRRPAENSRK